MDNFLSTGERASLIPSINQMEQEFDDIALDMDPDSIPLNANGAPIKTDSPTVQRLRIGLKLW